jgi:hypothetical protein
MPERDDETTPHHATATPAAAANLAGLINPHVAKEKTKKN